MNQLIRISKILEIEPFKITILWNNGEVRIVDFNNFFEGWVQSNNEHLLKLMDWEIFKNASVSTEPPRTIQWINLTQTITWKGDSKSFPTELDADALFKESALTPK